MRLVVLLGPPGAGKGTQARLLGERLGLPHVATGDLFRGEVRDGTPVGLEAQAYMDRGELVPDDLTIRILRDRLAREDARAGVILDGFPRTRAQAEVLDTALAQQGEEVEHALLIRVDDEELVRRMSGRWICEATGHVYNVHSNPPRSAGRCDLDDSPLVQRDDDRPETVRARLARQLGALAEVVEHYRRRGVLKEVDGERSIDAVNQALLDALAVSSGGRV
ncbi:MAG TPA: adenylate kinase [Candidatus Limnocylindrales bacterium]|nr:adenylate kinase [Candidatus Limnocylindrales bacterium]